MESTFSLLNKEGPGEGYRYPSKSPLIKGRLLKHHFLLPTSYLVIVTLYIYLLAAD